VALAAVKSEAREPHGSASRRNPILNRSRFFGM
jgi:hypothetical protein